MWLMFGHCFDCQIEFENKLKIKGEFDDWANEKTKKNKKAAKTKLSSKVGRDDCLAI